MEFLQSLLDLILMNWSLRYLGTESAQKCSITKTTTTKAQGISFCDATAHLRSREIERVRCQGVKKKASKKERKMLLFCGLKQRKQQKQKTISVIHFSFYWKLIHLSVQREKGYAYASKKSTIERISSVHTWLLHHSGKREERGEDVVVVEKANVMVDMRARATNWSAKVS